MRCPAGPAQQRSCCGSRLRHNARGARTCPVEPPNPMAPPNSPHPPPRGKGKEVEDTDTDLLIEGSAERCHMHLILLANSVCPASGPPCSYHTCRIGILPPSCVYIMRPENAISMPQVCHIYGLAPPAILLTALRETTCFLCRNTTSRMTSRKARKSSRVSSQSSPNTTCPVCCDRTRYPPWRSNVGSLLASLSTM